MNNTIEYKNYVGSVEFSEDDGIFFGKVQGIKSLVSYEGKNAKELIFDFHKAVDSYLQLCEAKGTFPEVAYKGVFNVRIPQKLHKKIAVYAMNHNITLNRCVEDALQKMIE